MPSPVCSSSWPLLIDPVTTEPALIWLSARAFLLFVRRSVEVAQLNNALNQGGAVETQLEYATHVVLCRDVTSLYANPNSPQLALTLASAFS